MTLNVKGEGLGAQVTGIDPGNLDGITTEEIRELVYRHKLVVLKGVHPTPEQFIELGRLIGEIVPYYEPVYHHQDHPEIFVSSTEEGQGFRAQVRSGMSTTCSCRSLSPSPWCCHWRYLGMTVVPTSSISARYGNRCLQRQKDAALGTFSTHTPRRYIKIRPSDVYRPIGEILAEIERTTPPQKWPTVIKHPKTGEEILYICEAGTETIEDGAGRIQDAALLQQLLEASGQLDPDYASPFIHAQHYEVGDIVLWDNRSLVHRAKHGTASGTLTTYRLTMLDGLEAPGFAA